MKRIPLFEKIELKDFTYPEFNKAVKEHFIGKVPTYIVLDERSEEVLNVLDMMLNVLERHDINPKIPYPLYVVTNQITHHEKFIILEKERDLPFHYLKKSKKLKSKEQVLLARTHLVANRVANMDVENFEGDLKSSFAKHRELNTTCRELDFYERIYSTLMSQE